MIRTGLNVVAASERILVIAGDGSQAQYAGTALERDGYQVSYAHRLPIGREIIHTLRPELVVIGSGLVDCTPDDVLKAVDALDPEQVHTAVIIIEEEGAPKPAPSARVAASLGADFEEGELKDLVQSVISSRRLLQEYRHELNNLKRAHDTLRQRFTRALLKQHYFNSDLDQIERELSELEGLGDRHQATERSKAISELAGAVSHELNQPLTIIIGRIQLMRRLPPDKGMTAQNFTVIEEQARRMADIVRKVGDIHEYATKPYVAGQRIIDLDKASEK